MVTLRKAAPLFALGLAAACKPDLDDRLSLVDEPRVLAIRAEPAEARPGTEVTYTALVGQGLGADGLPALSWSYCTARKPLAELGPVSTACLGGDPDALLPIGNGATAQAALPKDACRSFGPEVPAPKQGEPAGRPVDPDETGGFFQPVILRKGGDISLGRARIACGVAGVTPELLAEFQQRYASNTNPALTEVVALVGGAEIPLEPGDPGAGANRIPAGASVRLRASWPGCDGVPCAGSEPYVVFEPQARALVERTEAIRVAWFATDGAFDEDRTGVEAGGGLSSDNGWMAPEVAGPVRLWVVIRDDRGGAGWLDFVLDVHE